MLSFYGPLKKTFIVQVLGNLHEIEVRAYLIQPQTLIKLLTNSPCERVKWAKEPEKINLTMPVPFFRAFSILERIQHFWNVRRIYIQKK